MSIEPVIPPSHLILCHPLLLLSSIFPSIRVFPNESALRIRWPKYWSFSFSISPSNEHSGLISYRMNWLNFLSVQGTLKSLLQYHSSKASILQHSVFFLVQLSHPYMTTGKTMALARWPFVDKVMSLLFNMLSSLAKTFLPRSMHLLKELLKQKSYLKKKKNFFFNGKYYNMFTWGFPGGASGKESTCSTGEQEMWVRSLGQEDPLEKEMATLSSILPWQIPCTEEPGRLKSMGLQRVGHDWVTKLSMLRAALQQKSKWSFVEGFGLDESNSTGIGVNCRLSVYCSSREDILWAEMQIADNTWWK